MRLRLAQARRTGADEDEQDAALSAFDLFCQSLNRGGLAALAVTGLVVGQHLRRIPALSASDG